MNDFLHLKQNFVVVGLEISIGVALGFLAVNIAFPPSIFDDSK